MISLKLFIPYKLKLWLKIIGFLLVFSLFADKHLLVKYDEYYERSQFQIFGSYSSQVAQKNKFSLTTFNKSYFRQRRNIKLFKNLLGLSMGIW